VTGVQTCALPIQRPGARERATDQGSCREPSHPSERERGSRAWNEPTGHLRLRVGLREGASLEGWVQGRGRSKKRAARTGDRRPARACYSLRVLVRTSAARVLGMGPTPAAVAALIALLSLGGCGAATTRVTPAARASALGFTHAHTHLWTRSGTLVGSAGDELPFLEVVFGTDDVEAPLPLVLALHGFGDAPRIPDAPYHQLSRPYRMIPPRGPVAVGEGFAWSATRVLDGRPELLAADIEARLEPLAEGLETLRALRPTRGSTIVLGFSQGGIVTLALAARHPELVGLALPMAAWLPPALEPGPAHGGPPIRSIHARDDERVPVGPTVALFERKLSEHLDVPTLTAGLAWERSALAGRIRELQAGIERPDQRAAFEVFAKRFPTHQQAGLGTSPAHARARRCRHADCTRRPGTGRARSRPARRSSASAPTGWAGGRRRAAAHCPRWSGR